MLHQKTKENNLSMAGLNTTTGKAVMGSTMRRAVMPGKKSGRRMPKSSGRRSPMGAKKKKKSGRRK